MPPWVFCPPDKVDTFWFSSGEEKPRPLRNSEHFSFVGISVFTLKAVEKVRVFLDSFGKSFSLQAPPSDARIR